MQISKRCTSCNEDKELNKFGKQNTTKDGLKYRCKDCEKIAYKDRYNTQKEKIINSVKRWQSKNIKKVRCYKNKWAKTSREKNKESSGVQGDIIQNN